MEFAPAGDLASFLKAAAATRLPLPEATVWQVFLQLCQGMQVRALKGFVRGRGGHAGARQAAWCASQASAC
jgi:hypothetical protein